MVVAEAEVRAAFAFREHLRGLLHHIVHDGGAGRPVGVILAETLVIVRLPKGGVFLHGEEVLHVDADIRRQAVHPRDEHIQVEEHVIGVPEPQARVRVLEQAGQYVLVPREATEEELLGGFRIREDLRGALVAEGVRALVRPRRLHVHNALVRIDLRLRRLAGEGRAAGGHTDDGPHRRGGAGIHDAAFPEGRGETPDHRLGDALVLVPTDFREVAHAVLHIVPEGFQPVQEVLPVRGEVVLPAAFGQHIQEDRIGPVRIGVTGAVAAVMADIHGFIALRGGGRRLRGRVHDAVQAGGLVPVRPDLFADTVALGAQAQPEREGEDGKEVSFHIVRMFRTGRWLR